MKVLWFANTPCNADEYFKKDLKSTGGWLKALDKELQNFVELHVAFNYNEKIKPFKYKNTYYYPIHFKKNLLNKVKNFLDLLTKKEIDIISIKNKYLEIINIIKPDIIHIHGTENFFLSIVEDVNIPVVLSLQGILNVCVHKYFSGIEKEYLNFGQKKYLYLLNTYKLNYLTLKQKANIEKKYLSKIKYIIGRTHWDKRVSKILAPNCKYFHINEILRENFYNFKWSWPKNNKFIIHSTLTNAFYKGLETICQAANELKKLNINFEWRIAGIYNNELIVKIVKNKLNRLFPNDKIIFLGNLNENQLIEKLLEANIFVLASHIENSPNSLCEAMILGMPCISTYAGGTSSLIKNEKEGILIQNGDPWVLSGAILELLNNPSRAIKLGENSRSTALKRHDKHKILYSIINCYKNILKNEKI